MSADLFLSAPGAFSAADLCYKYGKRLVELYRTVKGARQGLDDRLLQVEAIWNKTDLQLKLIKRSWESLDKNQRRVQDRLLYKLSETLQQALVKLESTLGKKASSASASLKVNPLKYAFAKDNLDKTIQELEQWHRLYDPTWFLMTPFRDALVNELLAVRGSSTLGGELKPLSALSRLRSSVLSIEPKPLSALPQLRNSILGIELNPLSSLSQIRSPTLGSEPKPPSPLSQIRSILHGSKSAHVSLDHAQFDIANATPIKYTGGGIRIFSHTSSSSTATATTTATITNNTISSTTTSTTAVVTRYFLIDSIQLDKRHHADTAAARSDAELLAGKLGGVDQEKFGLLRCQGLVKEKSAGTVALKALHLFFRTPSWWPSSTSNPDLTREPPRSLREELLLPYLPRPATNGVEISPRYTNHNQTNGFRKPKLPSLTTRLETARSLASSVSFVHVCNLVHKNIRPESIVCFGRTDQQPNKNSVFLMGFDGFRTAHYQTLRKGDTAFERNLYRHPSRQGLEVQESYVMQHDIYSLGVCLLEVGLWRSLVEYVEGDSGPKPSGMLGLGDGSGVDIVTWPDETRVAIKDRLVGLAKEELPAAVGDRYTAVVVACLTCLDEGNADFATDGGVRDEDGVIVGVRFIEKVLMKLAEIAM